MKTAIISLCIALANVCYGVSGVYLPVYSYEPAAAELHVQELSVTLRPDNAPAPVKTWRFPASYTGKRSVCWLPGATTNMTFVAWVGSADGYKAGDPFGVSPPGDSRALALTRTSALTPHIDLWSASTSDRAVRRGESVATDNKVIAIDPATMPVVTRARVVRYSVDGYPNHTIGFKARVLVDRMIEKDVRGSIHEGDFLVDGALDIDWEYLADEVYNDRAVIRAGCDVTNMAYLVVIGDGDIEYYSSDDNVHKVYAHPYILTRRFEAERTAPTSLLDNGDSVCTVARPTFRWSIDGEDKWASAFGTTYTAFKIKVFSAGDTNTVVYDSGIRRMPPLGAGREYAWTPPVDIVADGGSYVWRVFTYNAKFKTDDVGSALAAFRVDFSAPTPAPEVVRGVYLPVYSYERSSTAELHIRTMTEDVFVGEKQWRFPASYTGKRSVCWLPGATTNMTFVAWVGSADGYKAGDPFGVSPPGDSRALALTRTSALTPRIKLWETTSDRVVRYGLSQPTNNTTATIPTAEEVRVRVIRFMADNWEMSGCGEDYDVVFDRTFTRSVRDYIHEGDFIVDGEFDIGWSTLADDIVSLQSLVSNLEVTNMSYAVVFGDAEIDRTPTRPFKNIDAHPYLITRRYEAERTAPTSVLDNGGSVCKVARPTFRWRIDGEDKWASAFGTTYTAFKVKVWNEGGDLVYDSGYQRMPAADSKGVYSWTPPVDVTTTAGTYTWRVFTYNAKFKTDDVGSVAQTLTRE